MQDMEIVQTLNKYFVSVFTSEDNNSIPKTVGNQGATVRTWNNITEEKYVKLIRLCLANPLPLITLPQGLKEVATEILDELDCFFPKIN